MISGRSGNRTTTPAAPLMDYEAGRGDHRSLAWAVAFSAGGMLVAIPAGGALIIALHPPEYGEWGGWSILGFMVGVGLFGLGVAMVALSIIRYWADSAAHRRRLEAAFDLEISLRERSGGVVVEESFEEFQLYAERPNDMLLLIVALTRRAATDPLWRPSISSLVEDGVWLERRKIGNVNTSQARKILTELAGAGFIRGRTDGSAGEWVYTDVGAAVERFSTRR